MRNYFAAALAAASLIGMTGCGGGYGGPSPGSVNGQTNAPAGAVVIDILGENGAQSFSPNPASIPAGQMVAWHNRDSITHHVFLNDGAVDTGDIGAGKFSAAMVLTNPGPYHCTIHPTMVGTAVRGQ
jgi:plastocyanin